MRSPITVEPVDAAESKQAGEDMEEEAKVGARGGGRRRAEGSVKGLDDGNDVEEEADYKGEGRRVDEAKEEESSGGKEVDGDGEAEGVGAMRRRVQGVRARSEVLRGQGGRGSAATAAQSTDPEAKGGGASWKQSAARGSGKSGAAGRRGHPRSGKQAGGRGGSVKGAAGREAGEVDGLRASGETGSGEGIWTPALSQG